jgi:hypothetical protein
MNLETLMRDVIILLENTHIGGDSNIIDLILDQYNPIMPKGVDVSTSNSNTDTDNSQHCAGGLLQVE